jgi:hypothetical protein
MQPIGSRRFVAYHHLVVLRNYLLRRGAAQAD